MLLETSCVQVTETIYSLLPPAIVGPFACSQILRLPPILPAQAKDLPLPQIQSSQSIAATRLPLRSLLNWQRLDPKCQLWQWVVVPITSMRTEEASTQ